MSRTVDATVLTDALLKVGEAARVAQAAMQDATVLAYAVKEVRHGPFGNFLLAHTFLMETRSYAGARRRVQALTRSPYRQRTAGEALTDAHEEAMQGDARTVIAVLGAAEQELGSNRPVDMLLARLMAGVLSRRLHGANRELTRLASSATAQLACFSVQSLTTNLDGTLDDGVRRCATACGLGAALAGCAAEVAQLIPVVQGLPAKPENSNRLAALQWVAQHPGQPPGHEECRALGDAVYALLCPAGGAVVTTNLADHRPLAEALGKRAVRP